MSEVEGLRAEVERLNEVIARMDGEVAEQISARVDAEAEVERLRERLSRMTGIARDRGDALNFADDHLPAWEAIRDQRDAAEVRLQKVEALADEWEPLDLEDPLPWAAEQLRAALAAEPAEQRG